MGRILRYSDVERDIIQSLGRRGRCAAEVLAALHAAGLGLTRNAKTISTSEIYREAREDHARLKSEAGIEARSNVYQWRHPEGAIINLPKVKGYVGEQAHG